MKEPTSSISPTPNGLLMMHTLLLQAQESRRQEALLMTPSSDYLSIIVLCLSSHSLTLCALQKVQYSILSAS